MFTSTTSARYARRHSRNTVSTASKAEPLVLGRPAVTDPTDRSDNLSQLTEHMSFSLPSRDMIADSMEMVGQCADGLTAANHR